MQSDATRRDGHDTTQCGACGGYGMAFNAAFGGLGGLPQECFCKYNLSKGHFRAILKTTRKKGFPQKLGKKKRFLPSKKGQKRFKRFPREAWVYELDGYVFIPKIINVFLSLIL